MVIKAPIVFLKHAVNISLPDGTCWTAQKGTRVTLIPHQFVFESLNTVDWRDLKTGAERDMPVPGSLFSSKGTIRINIDDIILADVDLRSLYAIPTLYG